MAAVMLSPSASGEDCWYSLYLLYWYKSTNTDSEVCSVVPAGEWSDFAAARGTLKRVAYTSSLRPHALVA